MKRAVRDEFIEKLESAARPSAYVEAVQLIANLVPQFTRTQNDLTELARAIRETYPKFPLDAEAVASELEDPQDPRSKVTESLVKVRDYAEMVAKRIEQLRPLLATAEEAEEESDSISYPNP